MQHFQFHILSTAGANHGNWLSMLSGIIIAALLSGSLCLMYFLLNSIAVSKLRHRIIMHDMNNAILVANLAEQLDDSEIRSQALGDIEGLVNLLRNDTKVVREYKGQVIHVNYMIKSIAQVLAHMKANRPRIIVESRVPLRVRSNLFLLRVLVTNLLKNAVESTTDGQVVVYSSEDTLYVENSASSRDIEAIRKPENGSTKGTGRGLGRKSMSELASKLGIDLSYQVDDEGNTVTAILVFMGGDESNGAKILTHTRSAGDFESSGSSHALRTKNQHRPNEPAWEGAS